MLDPLKTFLLHPDDSGSGGGGEEGNGDDTQGGGTPDPPVGSADAPGGKGDDQMVPAKEVSEARREAQALRKRLRDAEKERDELKAAQLSDSEKVVKERDDLKVANANLGDQIRTLRVQVLATEIGIIDPQAATRLLDWDEIKDPDDEKEIKEALRKLLEDKTYLAGNIAGGADGGASGGRAPAGGMNDLIREGARGRS